MARFIRKLAILCLPFALYGCLILWLDPFLYFHLPIGARFQPLRKLTATKLLESLWKWDEYSASRAPNLLLGDSRTDELPASVFSSTLGGEKVSNLAFGGATLDEIVDSFWFADRSTQLRRVWIGINFNMFSDYSRGYRTEAVRSLHENPLLYFSNRTVLKSAGLMVFYGVCGGDPGIGAVQLSRDQLWRTVVHNVAAEYYSRRLDPVRYRADLKLIADHCRQHNIQLRFVIHPEHVDLQNRVHDFHLDQQGAQFKQYLASLAPTYDFDYPNAITSNPANFRDPMHAKDKISQQIAEQVATGNLKFGLLLPPQSGLLVSKR